MSTLEERTDRSNASYDESASSSLGNSVEVAGSDWLLVMSSSFEILSNLEDNERASRSHPGSEEASATSVAELVCQLDEEGSDKNPESTSSCSSFEILSVHDEYKGVPTSHESEFIAETNLVPETDLLLEDFTVSDQLCRQERTRKYIMELKLPQNETSESKKVSLAEEEGEEEVAIRKSADLNLSLAQLEDDKLVKDEEIEHNLFNTHFNVLRAVLIFLGIALLHWVVQTPVADKVGKNGGTDLHEKSLQEFCSLCNVSCLNESTTFCSFVKHLSPGCFEKNSRQQRVELINVSTGKTEMDCSKKNKQSIDLQRSLNCPLNLKGDSSGLFYEKSVVNEPNFQKNANVFKKLMNFFDHLTNGLLEMQLNVSLKLKPTDEANIKNTSAKSYPIFISLLHSFTEANANATHLDMWTKIDVFEKAFDEMRQCVEQLQKLVPSETLYDVVSLNWPQLDQTISALNNDDTKNKAMDVLLNGPCRVFVPPPTGNSSETLERKGENTSRSYFNKTLGTVKKIGKSVRNTLETIKKLPNDFLTKSNSFGQRFKNTLKSMKNRFSHGYVKLKEKVHKKFKSSVAKLSKSVKSTWEKLNRQNESRKTLFSWARKRNLNNKGSEGSVFNIKETTESIKIQKDVSNSERAVEVADGKTGFGSDQLDSDLHKSEEQNFNTEEMQFQPQDEKKSAWYFRRVADREFLLTDPKWYFAMMEDRENTRHDSDWYLRNRRHSLSKYHKRNYARYHGR